MLVENSIVVANYIEGLFIPMKVLTGIVVIIGLFLCIEYDGKNKLWWGLPIVVFLMFSLWFFSTFTLK